MIKRCSIQSLGMSVITIILMIGLQSLLALLFPALRSPSFIWVGIVLLHLGTLTVMLCCEPQLIPRFKSSDFWNGAKRLMCTLPFVLLTNGLLFFIFHLIGYEPKSQDVITLFVESDAWVRLQLVVAAVFIAPICEEVFFRGILMGNLESKKGFHFAALISSVAFGVVHGFSEGFLALTILGYGFALAYRRRGRIEESIAMHSLFNAGSLFMVWLIYKFFGEVI